MSPSPSLPTDLSFEEAMERLEELVNEMEGENLALEQMVRAYEEGAGLLQVCKGRIESARQRVELITARLDAPAQVELTPFSPAESAPEEAVRPVLAKASVRKAAPRSAADEDDEIRLF